MITRSQMRRQLRAQGGIMNIAPREKFGLGSKIKERIRKLIPNEIANVATKAAPFVAPFNPAIAGIMRGVGRFDQRGSISDALKQGIGTYVGGQLLRGIGGGETQLGFRGADKKLFTSPLSDKRTEAIKGLFQGGEKKVIEDLDKVPTKPRKGLEVVQKGVDFVKEKIPMLENLPDDVAQKLLVGGITSGASALYGYFSGEFEPQQPGESMEEYMARRNTSVKQQMRGYMDSYYTPLRNPQYAAMSDEEKDNYIDGIVGQGMATGGRVELQHGGLGRRLGEFQTGAITQINPGEIPAVQGGGIMPRLNELGGGVSSAEEMLQEINTRLESADSKLGEGGASTAAALPGLFPGGGGLGTLANIANYTPQPRPSGGYLGGGNQMPLGGFPVPKVPGAIQQPGIGGGIGGSLTPLVQTPNPQENSNIFGYDPSGSSNAQDAYAVAQKAAQKTRAGGMLGQVILPGEMSFEDFSNFFNSGGLQPLRAAGSDSLSFPNLESLGKPKPLPMRGGGEMFRGGMQSQGTSGMGSPLQNALGFAKGGRIGLMGGTMPMGEPRVNQGGVTELDYRAKGGFVPVGIKEKADDVPAMLSKNEFVFTADAVKGAGNGSIEKGAQKMYDTMKNLERRVT